MGCADQLHAPLGDGAGGGGLQLPADLVDHDHFGVVVFDSFDHHFVLQHGLAHLHAACFAHGRVRNVAVAADLVGCVHDDDALGLRQDARRLAQQGGLAHSRPPQDQHGLAGLDDVLDDVHRAVHGAAHAQRQTHNVGAPVADGGDAVQRALDAGAVVGVELARAVVHVVDLGPRHLDLAQSDLAVHKARRRHAPQVQDDLQQVFAVVRLLHGRPDICRQNIQEGLQVVGDLQLGHGVTSSK